MPLSPALATWLNEQGHEAVHASALRMSLAPDAEILNHAVADRRIVVTADLDFARLLALLRADSPGLILFRGGRLSEKEAVTRLSRALQALSVDQLERSIVVIERARIRRRPLPIVPGDAHDADDNTG